MSETRAPRDASLQAWTRRCLSDWVLTLTYHKYGLTMMETRIPEGGGTEKRGLRG
jgi:hypothetical protein